MKERLKLSFNLFLLFMDLIIKGYKFEEIFQSIYCTNNNVKIL